jgi:hypothetical protein
MADRELWSEVSTCISWYFFTSTKGRSLLLPCDFRSQLSQHHTLLHPRVCDSASIPCLEHYSIASRPPHIRSICRWFNSL